MTDRTDGFSDITGWLRELGSARAPQALHRQVTGWESSLPPRRRYAPSPLNRIGAYTVAALVLLITVMSTAVYAVGTSRPGTSLYAVKRAAENAIVSVPLGRKVATFLNLKLAGERVDDIDTAVSASDSAALKQATEDYQEHVQNAVKNSVREDGKAGEFSQGVKENLEEQHRTLEDVGREAPEDARETVGKAREAVEQGIRDLQQVPDESNVKGVSAETGKDAGRSGDTPGQSVSEHQEGQENSASGNGQSHKP